MKPIPQMFTDETLRARSREAIRRKSVLTPSSTSMRELEQEVLQVVVELEEEIADLVKEHTRRGLLLPPEESPKPQASEPSANDLHSQTDDVLRARLDEANKQLCSISIRSKMGKQLKREITALEHELRRRGLPLPIDQEVARLK